MGVGREDERGDDELLLASARGDGAAFGVLYERHLAAVLAFVRRRTADAEAAADLTAEVFAAALVACPRYRPGETPALGWLLGIARNKSRESARRGRRRDEARRRLGVAEIPFAQEDLAGVEELVERGRRFWRVLKSCLRTSVWRSGVEWWTSVITTGSHAIWVVLRSLCASA